MELDNNLKESLIIKPKNPAQALSSMNLLSSKIKSHFIVLSQEFSVSIRLDINQNLSKEFDQIKALLEGIESEIIDIIELSKSSMLKESTEYCSQKCKTLLSIQNEINSNLPSVSKLVAVKSAKDNSISILIRKLNNLANQDLDIEIHEEFQPLLSCETKNTTEKSHKSYLFATLSMSFLVVGYIVMTYIYYLSFLKDRIYFSENS